MAEPAASEGQGEGGRAPFLTIFTFIACCVGIFETFRGVIEFFDKGLQSVEDALQNVDVVAVAEGFATGALASNPGLNWGAPWVILWGGLTGMWAKLVSGGWPSLLAGIAACACSIGLLAFCLSKTSDEYSEDDAAKWFARGIALVYGVIMVGCIGLVFEALVHPLMSNVPLLSMVDGGIVQFADGFNAAVADPAGSGAVASFIGSFALAHIAFILITLVVGTAVTLLIAFIADKGAPPVAWILLPFGVFAVILVGATMAFALDHLLVVPAIALVLKIATITIFPAFFTGLAFLLEKGHIGLSFLESSRKLFLRK